jgi:hypothetical protein
MVEASGRSGMAPSVTNSPGHAALSELKDIPRVSPLLAGKRRMVYFMFTGPLTTELFLMVQTSLRQKSPKPYLAFSSSKMAAGF